MMIDSDIGYYTSSKNHFQSSPCDDESGFSVWRSAAGSKPAYSGTGTVLSGRNKNFGHSTGRKKAASFDWAQLSLEFRVQYCTVLERGGIRYLHDHGKIMYSTVWFTCIILQYSTVQYIHGR